MIFITGDKHREQDIAKINPDDKFPLGQQLTADDYLIICGDFGCIWDGGKGDAFWLNWLESLPWQTCFIDGNHENFTLLLMDIRFLRSAEGPVMMCNTV